MAKILKGDLYIVGGFVRNALLGLKDFESDIDLTGSKTPSEVKELLSPHFKLVLDYASFGTILILDGEKKYEYTCFRTDSYLNSHRPCEVTFTKDIEVDAKRRDFTVNAIYYNIEKGEIVDPLGGISHLEKALLVCCNGEKTFAEDGLRILRLVRFFGELNFNLADRTLEFAIKNQEKLGEITAERKRVELDKILYSDVKYGKGYGKPMLETFDLMEKINVFFYLFPELLKGVGMAQNPKYHDYDVFHHIIRAAAFAEPKIRLYVLMHDIGKPKCLEETGVFYTHNVFGVQLVEDALGQNGLKYPKDVVNRAKLLTVFHMTDLKGDMSVNKVRIFMLENYKIIDDLISLKIADAMGGKVVSQRSDSFQKWTDILREMREENVPFEVSQLEINGREVLEEIGEENAKYIAFILRKMQIKIATKQLENKKDVLLSKTKQILKEVQNAN